MSIEAIAVRAFVLSFVPGRATLALAALLVLLARLAGRVVTAVYSMSIALRA